MKTRTHKVTWLNANDTAETPVSIAPTFEEIRERAHAILLARGGAPGNKLEDWLRAEQQLKQERVKTAAAPTA